MSQHDHIAGLLKLAGHRHMPDAEQMSRARAAARAEWTHVVHHQRRRFSILAFSAAALVAVALIGVTWFRAEDSPGVPASEIATLQKVVGTVLVTQAGVAETIAGPGFRVHAGDRLATPMGSRVALVLSSGALARLDQDSTITLDANDALTLLRGAVFVDAGPESRARDLHVTTPLGVVRHVGTQFEVRLQDGEVRVRVREGTIAFENTTDRWVSHAGEALTLASGRETERRAIATYGSEWNWLDDLAPPFTLEGSTLGAFLQWISRHHGLRWQYEDPAMRDRVERITLHGSIEGLTAEEALAGVLPTCGLTFQRKGDLFVIRRLSGK